MRDLHVFISVGETSGDILGARLMASMRAQMPGVRFSGVGGPLMAAQGLESLFPMRELSVMGIVEVLPKLPRILRRIKESAQFIASQRPDIVVTIDAPDFSFRVVKRARALGADTPLFIHYVAPTVWAWRPERAGKLAKLYDGLICLFPFEPPYFIREGMSAICAGHPVMETDYDRADGDGLRRALNIPPRPAHVTGVLFGSRAGELKKNGPVLRDALLDIARLYPDMHFLSLTLPHLEGDVRSLLAALPQARVHVTSDPAHKWAAFRAMDQAVAVSGTVGLELAVAGVAHVIAYRTNALTAAIIRRKIKVKYAHLANLLLDRPVIGEFLQENCTKDHVAQALAALIQGDHAQITAGEEVRALLRGEKNGQPSEQAARYILDLFAARV